MNGAWLSKGGIQQTILCPGDRAWYAATSVGNWVAELKKLRCGLVALALLIGLANAEAQELITSTPVRINVPTEAAPAVEIFVTPTVTRTPTPSTVMLEAQAGAGEVNVRAEADIESERLGTIRSGEFYPVLGRYFRWIQFQFDSSPTGRAWVFDELVTITGDESAIPDLSQVALPTEDPIAQASTQTQIAISLTPGGLLTSTVEAREIDIPLAGQIPETPSASDAPSVLPTFTFPPDIIAIAPAQPALSTTPPLTSNTLPLTVPNTVPPIVPIVLLAGGGLLGILVSALRR